MGAFTPVIFVAAFLASVTADVVCRVLTGETPVFAFRGCRLPSLNALPVALVVGAIAGFGGVLFNRCSSQASMASNGCDAGRRSRSVRWWVDCRFRRLEYIPK